MSFVKSIVCRCCGGGNLSPYLDLGRQPPANLYHRGGRLPEYPLSLLLCDDCFHSQLSIALEPRTLGERGCRVRATGALRHHLAAMARDLVDRLGLRRTRVVDIGCNDATLLERFRFEGAEAIGVGSNPIPAEWASDKQLPFVLGDWNAATAAQVGRADIITATNCLAQVHDVESFLQTCRGVLAPGGLIAVEFPDWRRAIDATDYDIVCHERLSYFLLGPAAKLAERLRFEIVDLSHWPIHGGTLRLLLRDSMRGHCAAVGQRLQQERQAGFGTLRPYREFAGRVERTRGVLTELVADLQAQGARVVGYGASPQGNTLLNHCQLKLPYVVDDDPRTWGYLTPGRSIPVRQPASLQTEADGLNLLLLTGNSLSNILQKYRALRPGRRDFIVRTAPQVIRHSLDAAESCLEPEVAGR